MNTVRKITEVRPKVSSHLDVIVTATSIIDAETQRTSSHKVANRYQNYLIHHMRLSLQPRLSRGRLSIFQLTILIITRLGHPRRNGYVMPPIINKH